MSSIPVRDLHELQAKLRIAMDAKAWKEVASIAREMVRIIPLAVDKKTCNTGRPHLDGVYRVGTMSYDRAPPKARRYLNMMNNVIKTASKSLPRK